MQGGFSLSRLQSPRALVLILPVTSLTWMFAAHTEATLTPAHGTDHCLLSNSVSVDLEWARDGERGSDALSAVSLNKQQCDSFINCDTDIYNSETLQSCLKRGHKVKAHTFCSGFESLCSEKLFLSLHQLRRARERAFLFMYLQTSLNMSCPCDIPLLNISLFRVGNCSISAYVGCRKR